MAEGWEEMLGAGGLGRLTQQLSYLLGNGFSLNGV